MSFRDSILNNAGQKIFSLGLATLVWFAIHVAAPDEPEFPVLPTFRTQSRGDARRPVTIMNSAKNPRAFSLSLDMVDVVVSGDAKKIKELDPASIRVFVDVSKVTTKTSVPVEVSPPANITFEEVYPVEIIVTPLPVDTNTVPTDIQ